MDTATLQAKACDRANNCTTAGLTNGGVCDSILAGAQSLSASLNSEQPDEEPLDGSVTPAAGPVVPSAAAADGGATAASLTPAIVGDRVTPAIAFASTVLTRTHYSEAGTVSITGYVTGLRSISGIQVTVDGVAGTATFSDAAPASPYTVTWSSRGGRPPARRLTGLPSRLRPRLPPSQRQAACNRLLRSSLLPPPH